MPPHLPAALFAFAAILGCVSPPAHAQPQLFQQMESMLCDPQNPRYNPTGCEQVRKAPRQGNPNQWTDRVADPENRRRIQEHQMYQERLQSGVSFRPGPPGSTCQQATQLLTRCREYFGPVNSTQRCADVGQDQVRICGGASAERGPAAGQGSAGRTAGATGCDYEGRRAGARPGGASHGGARNACDQPGQGASSYGPPGMAPMNPSGR